MNLGFIHTCSLVVVVKKRGGSAEYVIMIGNQIKHRNIGRGCPRCSILKRGYSHTKTRILNNGSLANMNPNLASQWHPTKNQGLTPDDVTSMSNKIVWWN